METEHGWLRDTVAADRRTTRGSSAMSITPAPPPADPLALSAEPTEPDVLGEGGTPDPGRAETCLLDHLGTMQL